eukprot:m.17892 g.17892  ORF g.17892 m.17892 type:complete len:258 (+) comp8208_c0_seq2:74-847(+)
MLSALRVSSLVQRSLLTRTLLTPVCSFASSASVKKPTRPTKFFLFSKNMRAQVVESHPELSACEVATKLGDMYRNLPAADNAQLESQLEAQLETYNADLEKFQNSLDPRPKKMTIASQVTEMLRKEKGSAPSIDDISSTIGSLTPEQKQTLEAERKEKNEKIAKALAEWNERQSEGLAFQAELKKKLNHGKSAKAVYAIGKKRGWVALKDFPKDISDCSMKQLAEFQNFKHQRDLKNKRLIRNKLKAAGFFDVANTV